ncbi:cache domain-containing protein [Gordonia sp. (in: high G+C Gram-positive bacteria)]|uniref:cache domain-containing protein n=1 Tax=Gordonia sp. (in: high G+C Gram-positive bacteria) TaxID=84139 RepID=UPI003C781B71
MPTSPEAAAVARSLAEISTSLQRWSVSLGHSLAAHRGTLNAAAIERAVKPTVAEVLKADDSVVSGGGFIAAPGLLNSDRYYMAWWQGTGVDRVDPIANLSDAARGRYLTADWYVTPISTGHMAITGPYVDLLCTDEFSITYTAAVDTYRPDGPAGVVGFDVTVAALEHRILTSLKTVSPGAALVNSEDRAIVTSSPLVAPGEFIRDSAQRWDVGHGLSIVA